MVMVLQVGPPGQTGKALHLVLPLKESIPANTNFSVQMLFTASLCGQSWTFRISVTSDLKSPVAKAWAEVEAVLATEPSSASRSK